MKKTTLLWLLLAALGACDKPIDPIPPGDALKAAFRVTNAGTITAGCQPVLFENQSENAATYQWDFGDGTQSTEANPQHQYTTGGTYIVVLTAISGSETAADTTTVTVANASRFSRIFQFAQGESNLAKTPDGGYILVRHTTTTTLVGVVSKYNASGDLQWEVQLEPNNISHSADDVAVTPDGSIYVVGFSDYNLDDEDDEATIWRLTPAGNIVWRKRLGGLFDQFFTTITVLDDGSFWAGGATLFLNSFYLGFVAGFDANGNVAFETNTGTGVQGSWVSSIVQAEDGHLLVGGTGYPGIDPNLNLELWVNKINRNDRSLMWAKTYDQTPADAYSPKIIRTSDHQFAMIKNTSGIGTYLLKIDATGNLLSQIKLKDNCYIESLVELPDRSITVAGSYNRNWYMANFNAAGSILNWEIEKDYLQGIYDKALDFEQTPDGGYYVCGTTGYTYSDQLLWLVKTDCSGN